MSDLARVILLAAARRAFPLHAVIVAAVLAGLTGLFSLTGLMAATLQAKTDDAREAGRAMAMPSAQATGVTRAGTSVPDASAVFAGRDEVVEEPAPTF
jgi:hypothetical protein